MSFTYDAIYKSPNFGYPKGREGRGGHEIIAIGLHITGAGWESNYHWIMNPAANAGYNAVVRDDGSVVSLVPEENAAYSHGRINKPTWPLLKKGVNPNLYTLSVARTGSNQNTWTKAQLDATVALLRHWGEKYNISLKPPFIFGHFEIDSVGRWYCPGVGFYKSVLAESAKPVPKTRDLRKAMLENSGAEEGAGGGENGADDEANGGVRAYYRVVVGSYADEAAAKRHVNRLNAEGVEAFVALYLDDTEKLCLQARDERKAGRR